MTTMQLDTAMHLEPFVRLSALANRYGANTTPEQLRNDYIDLLRRREERPPQPPTVKRPNSMIRADKSTHVGPYDVSFYDVFTVSIEGDFNPPPDWSLDLSASLEFMGKTVWKTSYKFTPEDSSVTFSPNLGLVKAEITIGIFGSNLCLRTYGEGCYWAPFSWHCASFDETLVCFG